MKRLLSVFLLVFLLSACSENPKTKEERSTNKEKKDSLLVKKLPEKHSVQPDYFYDTLANFLAGVPVSDTSSFWFQRQQTPFYRNYKNRLDKIWELKDKNFTTKLIAWADKEMSEERHSKKAVFYPFSGPDFLTIYALFPEAPKYLLLGLEPEGHIRRYKQFAEYPYWQKDLKTFTLAIDDLMRVSFFKTRDMERELKAMFLDGTTPILLFFMKKNGLKILNVQRVKLDSASLKLVPIADSSASYTPWDSVITGVRIYFTKHSEETPKELIFLAHDASDEAQNKDSTLIRFIKKFAEQGTNTYVKAASYLMYKSYFSKIRNTVLAVSDFYLQDNSGMPIKFLDKNLWDITFYGNYIRPIPLFANWYQPELRKIYLTDTTIKPLDFGIGYEIFKERSNLLLARKKKSYGRDTTKNN